MFLSDTSMLVLLFVFMVNLAFTMVSLVLDLFFRAALFILRASISRVSAVSPTSTSPSLSEAVIQHSEGNIRHDLSDEQRADQLETRVEALKQRLVLRENANAALQRKYLALREDANAALQSTNAHLSIVMADIRQEKEWLERQVQTLGLFAADPKLVEQELERVDMETLVNRADVLRRKVKYLDDVVKHRDDFVLKLARCPIYLESQVLPGAPIASLLPTPPASPALAKALFDNERTVLSTSVFSSESAASPVA